MSFIQVLLLLGLVAYVLLVSLENTAPVRLPLPLGRGEVTLTLGQTVSSFLVVGGVYMAFLLLPALARERTRRLRERRSRLKVESHLAAALQAHLGDVHPLPDQAPEENA